MKLSFNLEVNDWVAFQEYYKGKKTPFYNLAYPLIVGLGIALVAINAYHVYAYGASNVTWFSLLILAGLTFVLYIRNKALQGVKKAGLEMQKKHPEAFGPMSMDVKEQGITIQSQQSSKFVAWNEMAKFEENKHYFFLFSKKGVIYIVPKREMDNQSAFRDELISNIEQN